jgi:hypothetical protein
MMLMGFFIGELVYLIAGGAFIVELRGKSTPRRDLVWPAIHLLLVLLGLELATRPMFDAAAVMALADWLPAWVGVAFGVGNMFGLAVVPLFVLKTYPEKTTAMARETLTPLVLGLGGAWLAPWFAEAAPPMATDGLTEALTFLGMHHLTLLGLSLGQALIDPPAHGAAASLSLRARLGTFEGRLLAGITGLGIAQAALVVALQGRATFADGWIPGLTWAALLGLSVVEALRKLGTRRDMSGGALWRR